MNMNTANMFFAAGNVAIKDSSAFSATSGSSSAENAENLSFISMLGSVNSAEPSEEIVADDLLLEDESVEEITLTSLLQDFSSFISEEISNEDLNLLLEKLPKLLEKLASSKDFNVDGNVSLLQKGVEILETKDDFAETALAFYQKLAKIIETASNEENSANELVTGIFEALSNAKKTNSSSENDLISASALDYFASFIYQNIISDEVEISSEKSLETYVAQLKTASENIGQNEALITAEDFLAKLEASTVVTYDEALTQFEKFSKKISSYLGENALSDEKNTGEIEVVKFINNKNSDVNLFQDLQSYNKMSLNIVDAKDTVESIKSATEKSAEENAILPQTQTGNSSSLTVEQNTIYKELSEIAYRQIEKPILENISNGKSEFTAILKPENLGEIAVKITENTSGEVSIILSATNPEVAKALSFNAGTVAAELAKMNVDVDSVNVVTPSEASSYMNLDFTNQGFNRREENSENSSNNSSGNNISTAEISEISNAQKLLKEAKLLWQTA